MAREDKHILFSKREIDFLYSQMYGPNEIAKARLELLRHTNMIGYAIDVYKELDDNDIWSALKVWTHHDDKVLSRLADDMVNRRIFKVEVSATPFPQDYVDEISRNIANKLGIDISDSKYFVALNTVEKDMYDPEDDSISILYKDGTTKDISEASELLNVELLSKKIRKYYLCYQRI